VVPGYLGTSTLDGAGSDAPWIPFLPVRAVSIAAGSRVVIRFGDGTGIGRWQVQLATAADRTATRMIGLGGRETDLPPLQAVEPEPLPAGCWVLAATLSRSDRRGGGVTYWSVAVTP
jgi:hypothetical protein